MVWPVSVLCEYSNFIPVLAHNGHVPRPFEGRLLIVFPLFLFAILIILFLLILFLYLMMDWHKYC